MSEPPPFHSVVIRDQCNTPKSGPNEGLKRALQATHGGASICQPYARKASPPVVRHLLSLLRLLYDFEALAKSPYTLGPSPPLPKDVGLQPQRLRFELDIPRSRGLHYRHHLPKAQSFVPFTLFSACDQEKKEKEVASTRRLLNPSKLNRIQALTFPRFNVRTLHNGWPSNQQQRQQESIMIHCEIDRGDRRQGEPTASKHARQVQISRATEQSMESISSLTRISPGFSFRSVSVGQTNEQSPVERTEWRTDQVV